jgi:hypothetical protein
VSLPTKGPLPQPSISYLFGQGQQVFAQYLTQTDVLLSALAAGQAPNLKNAVDDAAAARAGVAVGSYYRNGSQVMVRVA